jgi:hypothetical protein
MSFFEISSSGQYQSLGGGGSCIVGHFATPLFKRMRVSQLGLEGSVTVRHDNYGILFLMSVGNNQW